MGDAEAHDDLLFNMLKDCLTLPVFLDHVFGFLYRRTDFYHIATDRNSPVGLPPGLAEQVLKNSFYKWKSSESNPEVPNATTVISETPKPSKHTQPDIDPKFTASESYNGGEYENYSWSQNLREVDISIKIPHNKTTKDLVVQILSDQISVRLKDDTVLLDGVLCDKCKQNDALWSLHKTKLDIHLDKAREVWWNCLLKSEPKLDTNKLDCSRPFEELTEEAQAKIEELQWNQQRKKMGLPTSDEMAVNSMLKKSWDLEGSPFSGPFNPSTVKFN